MNRPIAQLMDSTGLSGAHWSTESAVYTLLPFHTNVRLGIMYTLRTTNTQALAEAAYVSGTQDPGDTLVVEGRSNDNAPWVPLATLAIGTAASASTLLTLLPQVRVKCAPLTGAVYKLWIAE